jgi:hypothetical protein
VRDEIAAAEALPSLKEVVIIASGAFISITALLTVGKNTIAFEALSVLEIVGIQAGRAGIGIAALLASSDGWRAGLAVMGRVYVVFIRNTLQALPVGCAFITEAIE